ncbi:hypothetical protein AB4099_25600 [Bosea sp. 2KB_26]|uniref:hypothetical protein n=1 Tax=Bosea sp. 2KB_26 TaxID=3237475 RepID=UPI003F92E133
MFKKASGHLNGAPLTGWSTAKPTAPADYRKAGGKPAGDTSPYTKQREALLKRLLKHAANPEVPKLDIPTVLQSEIAEAGGLQEWAQRELPRLKQKSARLMWFRPKKRKK